METKGTLRGRGGGFRRFGVEGLRGKKGEAPTLEFFENFERLKYRAEKYRIGKFRRGELEKIEQ